MQSRCHSASTHASLHWGVTGHTFGRLEPWLQWQLPSITLDADRAYSDDLKSPLEPDRREACRVEVRAQAGPCVLAPSFSGPAQAGTTCTSSTDLPVDSLLDQAGKRIP
jgi:hypothetical protein